MHDPSPPIDRIGWHSHVLAVFILFGILALSSAQAETTQTVSSDLDDPEMVIRLLVRANAQKDLATMKAFMATDASAIGYTIGGRTFIGWDEFAQAMTEEFAAVTTLDIPITSLRVWRRGDVAWFAMELDYIREVATSHGTTRMTIPLRETGVLERRGGKWVLVNWHESLQRASNPNEARSGAEAFSTPQPPPTTQPGERIDVAGVWDIHEEDKSYRAILDTHGNGTYTWQDGTLNTTRIEDRLWSGTWSQKGNDREGGFEVLLAPDLQTAEGVWWYTRVGQRDHIPPREWGGTYRFIRVKPLHPTRNP